MHKGGSEWNKMEGVGSSKTQNCTYQTTYRHSHCHGNFTHLHLYSGVSGSDLGLVIGCRHWLSLVRKYVDYVTTAAYHILSNSSTSIIYSQSYKQRHKKNKICQQQQQLPAEISRRFIPGDIMHTNVLPTPLRRLSAFRCTGRIYTAFMPPTTFLTKSCASHGQGNRRILQENFRHCCTTLWVRSHHF
jgi:hypothetical protein